MHTINRGAIVNFIDTWVANTHARFSPDRISDMHADGAPELSSPAFRHARVVEDKILLHTGAPYAHHHQAPVERSQRTLQDRSRTSRIAAGMPPEFWAVADVNTNASRNLLPTTAALSTFKPTEATPRVLSPFEEWN